MIDDVLVNAYVQNLNATPADTFPEQPANPEAELFDGVSKDILDLQDLAQKLNDVNKALTDFEVKSNEWHDFLIQQRDSMDIDVETFKEYETDEKSTLTSINKIKAYLLQINNEMTVLRDTLKQ